MFVFIFILWMIGKPLKLRALPLTNKDASRAFSRFFVAGATTCELDKQENSRTTDVT